LAKRLNELYRPGDEVEFTFGGDRWLPAFVIKSDPPGLWLRDGRGQNWYVTNGRHIRPTQTRE